ncbi:hypothetical protein A2Z33_04545 [Candidatus Gottesmanbacteria bacterium RBG_16_52_11]|uniref:LamG-like jellyroll fold domain-containing protein n=1 Tax=Candidatus Gottesmanbacteria bacterium RBG_16_52_11 TaxID=1798374 RepID=A0A1F5YNB2_9BACT|nr:MAG: hypothetical protein A2Z33_04545 [Candidatus Gottesmanbacteria bacterium RBG_16_52_11]
MLVRKYASTEPSPAFGSEASASYGTADKMTLSAWVNADTLDSTQRNIISRGSSPAFDWTLASSATSAGKLFFSSDGHATAGISNATLSTGSWYHVAMTVEGTKTKLFINGNLDRDIDSSGFIPGVGTIAIGAAANGSQGWDGKIDDVRIYDRALSPADISRLYNWASGPVAYYKFDEGKGTANVYDSSGFGNIGTINGGMTENDWVPGRIGTALDFDGSNDNISVADTASLRPDNGDWSLSLWAKPPNSNQTSTFVSKRQNTGDYEQWSLSICGNNGCGVAGQYLVGIFRQSEAVERRAISTSDVADGSWHHYSMIADKSANKIKLFQDGVELVTTLTTDGVWPTVNNADSVKIGHDNGSLYFSGAIDDVKIYNYARTPAQVVEDMNAGHPAPGSPVGSAVLHINFDEGYGDTANNSGNGGTVINGNLAGTGSCPGGNACPVWSNSGKVGKALDFETSGTSDYTAVSDDVSLDITAAMSLEAWFKLETLPSDPYCSPIIHKDADSSGYSPPNYGRLYDIQVCSGLASVQFWDGSTVRQASCTTPIQTDNWYHVVGTFDGTSVKCYMNGKSEGTASFSQTSITTSSRRLFIGAGRIDAGNVEYTDGLVDEVKIYSSALTSDQVYMEYNQGMAAVMGAVSTDASNNASWSGSDAYCPPGQGTACTAPVGEWEFDENTGTTANDTSGNGKTGTLTAGPVWTTGKIGSSVRFDGTDDFIDVGSGPSTVKTVSFWVNPQTSTEYPVDLNGSAYVWINAGAVTAQGFTSPTIYVNGLVNGSVSTGVWNYVVVTTAMGLNASDFDIGRIEGVGYHEGMIDLVRLYDYARTPAQIAWDYNRGSPSVRYKFDDCQGTTAHNAAPTASGDAPGNNASILIGATAGNTSAGSCSSGQGSEAWNDGTTGKRNYSLDFDGADDVATVSAFSPLASAGQTTTNLSWGSWLYPKTSAASKTIMEKVTEFRLTTDGSGKPICDIYTGGAFTTNTAGAGAVALSLSSWNHVLCTYDGINIKVYLNGNQTDSWIQGSSITAASSALHIAQNSSSAQRFEGQLDEMTIFTYPLTIQQVRNLVNGGAVNYGPLQGAPQ